MKKIVLSILLCVQVFYVSASESPGETEVKKIDYLPAVHGVIRSRWEMETENGENRFEVRNARVALSGNILPAVDYLVQADFCDQGKIKILDAWGGIKIAEGLKLRAGQFLMPVGIEPLRAPAAYIFANRAFIGKHMCNARGVGAEVAYAVPSVTPITVKAAVFNPASVSDHDVWEHSPSFSASALWQIGAVGLNAGFQSSVPAAGRTNITDAAVIFKTGRWNIEAEYMYKHYVHSYSRPAHGYSVFGDYCLPVSAGVFNRLSFQGRFDGMTAHNSGMLAADNTLSEDMPARNRITLGATVGHVKQKIHADIRLNYEKYFYHSNVDAPRGEGDKVVVEFVVSF